MNIIQMQTEVSFLVDRESSARFTDDQYMTAINSAIVSILEDRLDNIKNPKRYSFESVQRVRDELYTLVPPTVTIVPVGNLVPYPSNYNYFLKLECIIDGNTTLSRPTSYNESGTLPENPFKKPSNTKTYFDQNADGFVIDRGAAGTFSAALLDYVKNPDTVTIGNPNNKITDGGALVIGSVYIVYEEAVENSVTYYEGQTFTAATAVLTSGTVILNSIVVNCNLPVKLHKEITRLAASYMTGTISEFDKEQDLVQQNKQQ